MANCLNKQVCVTGDAKNAPQLVYEIDANFLLIVPVIKTIISQDCCSVSMKITERKCGSSADHCQSFLDPDAPYWTGVLHASQQCGFIFLSDSEHAEIPVHVLQRSASSLKGLSMQMVKYAAHSKFSLPALAQLAQIQGDFSSNLNCDSCAFPNMFQSISNHLIALVKELTTFLVLTTSMTTLSYLLSTI